MQEIKCPKCGEFFGVDESGYANIVKQVRDKEFARELRWYSKKLIEVVGTGMSILNITLQIYLAHTV